MSESPTLIVRDVVTFMPDLGITPSRNRFMQYSLHFAKPARIPRPEGRGSLLFA